MKRPPKTTATPTQSTSSVLLERTNKGVSRRDCLKYGLAAAGLGVGGCALALAAGGGCAGNAVRTEPNEAFGRLPISSTRPIGQVALARQSIEDPEAALRQFLPLVGDDLSWARPGDSVFIKLSCNSGKKHPMVTWPGAITALVAILRDKGVGRILVGDQSGVGHVRHTPNERRSSTRECMTQSGLLAAIEQAGAEPCFFDEQPWDEGWFQPERDFEDCWEGKIWLPSIIQQVDHIVNLPRLSAHVLAGYTGAIKIAVGWLRDDTRCALHQQGDLFYERIAEISHFRPLRDKIRLSLTMGTHALLNIGPDIGSRYNLGGILLVGSPNLVDHDAVVAAMLPWLDGNSTSIFDIYTPYPKHASYWNRGFVKDIWGKEAIADYQPLNPPDFSAGLAHDVFTSHLGRLQGYRPAQIAINGPQDTWPKGLKKHLGRFGAGQFQIAAPIGSG